MKVGVLLVFRLGCEAPLEMVRRKGVIQAIIDRHAFMHSSSKKVFNMIKVGFHTTLNSF